MPIKAVDATIVSHLFWPQLPAEDFTMPAEVSVANCMLCPRLPSEAELVQHWG